MRYGILGYPLSHTVSPMMHNAQFSESRLDAVYFPLPVPPSDFKSMAKKLPLIFNGFNVTVPYKESVLPLLDSLSTEAEWIGAVNTITVTDQRMQGANTDWEGFRDSLCYDYGISLKDQTVLLLGAGGSTRAALYAACQAKAKKVYIVNRTLEKARALVQLASREKTEVEALSMDAHAIRPIAGQVDLVVNTTPIGLHPSDKHYFDFSDLGPNAFVYDLLYTSPKTDFLQRACAAGFKTGDGKGMLVRQGALSFETWTGEKASLEVMSQAAGFSMQQGHIR